MPIAWHQLRVPGPPAELELTAVERHAPSLTQRFARRTIQELVIAQRPSTNGRARAEPGRSASADERIPARLALIDKASPHALFDLMLCEVTPSRHRRSAASDPGSVAADVARVLWSTAAHFHRFVSDPGIRDAFGLGGGAMHLALNCDPLTRDRESVQALKRFHVHLIYWRAAELAPLQSLPRFGDQTARYLARQCLDPLSFIGPSVLNPPALNPLALNPLALNPQALNALTSAQQHNGGDATWLSHDIDAVCAGLLPLGALARLPGWDRLAAPEFEQLIRRLHDRISETAQTMKRAFTGTATSPARWSRHRLLPQSRIGENLDALDLSAESQAQLLALAKGLRDLRPESAQRLQRASPAQRQHCMTLNQPCYSLCLSPFPADASLAVDAPVRAADAAPPLLSVQLKLFSGIGGAGLLSLPGRPSVRVVRGQGRFSREDWRQRAEFQRRFAAFNTTALQEATNLGIGLRAGPVHRLQDLGTGWTP
jgi:hypothetical protein